MATVPTNQGTFSQIWPVLLLLVGVILAGSILISLIRRWMRSDGSDAMPGFTLSDLRTLHAQGKITPGELERAQQQMISRVRGEAASTASIRIRPATKSEQGTGSDESSSEDAE